MDEILAGNATPVQIAGFMVALQAKGATPDELNGLVTAMLDNARPISLPTREAVDIVGTGGDRANTVNVSTMAAIVTAGGRARRWSSTATAPRRRRAAPPTASRRWAWCSTSPPASRREVFDEAGIVFLFASHYHPSLRHAAVPRRELGIRTTFNFLGPLANPARPPGPGDRGRRPAMAALMADVLAGRGNRGLVFHGGDGLDELTTTTTERRLGDRRRPRRRGHARPRRPRHRARRRAKEDLVGGDPAHNAQVVRDTFAGRPARSATSCCSTRRRRSSPSTGPDPDADLAEQLRRAAWSAPPRDRLGGRDRAARALGRRPDVAGTAERGSAPRQRRGAPAPGTARPAGPARTGRAAAAGHPVHDAPDRPAACRAERPPPPARTESSAVTAPIVAARRTSP